MAVSRVSRVDVSPTCAELGCACNRPLRAPRSLPAPAGRTPTAPGGYLARLRTAKPGGDPRAARDWAVRGRRSHPQTAARRARLPSTPPSRRKCGSPAAHCRPAGCRVESQREHRRGGKLIAQVGGDLGIRSAMGRWGTVDKGCRHSQEEIVLCGFKRSLM